MQPDKRSGRLYFGQIGISLELTNEQSIQDIIDWVKSQHFSTLMRQQYHKNGLTFEDIPPDAQIEIRLNTTEGQPMRKQLTIAQFHPSKRIKFYASFPNNKNKEQSGIQESGRSRIHDQKQKYEIVQISIMNNNGDQPRKTITVDVNSPVLKTFADIQRLIQNEANTNSNTKYIFKNPHNQKIFPQIRNNDNFRDFVRANQIKQLHASPHYPSG